MKPKPQKHETGFVTATAAFLFIAAGVFLALAALTKKPSIATDASVPSAAREISNVGHRASSEAAETYKRQIGERLNRDRVLAELQTETWTHSAGRLKVEPQDPLIDGLPFGVEALRMRENGERELPAHVDSEIEADLANRHEEEMRTIETQKRFLKDYVANARAQGYDVVIDRNMNVYVRGAVAIESRMPQSEASASALAFRLAAFHLAKIDYAFRYAPFCSIN